MNSSKTFLKFKSEELVRVLKFVDPGSLWITPASAISALELHMHLKKDIDKSNQKLGYDYSPSVGECVLVVDPEDNRYYRGIVKCVEDRGIRGCTKEDRRKCYRIFLVDKGEVVYILGGEGEVLRPLPHLWTELPPQCCLIGIYGLVPATKLTLVKNQDNDYLRGVLFEWEEDTIQVRDILPEGSEAFFKPRRVVDEILYGDLYIQGANRRTDVRAELVNRGVGRISDSFEPELLILHYLLLDFAEELTTGQKKQVKNPDSDFLERSADYSNKQLICPEEHLLYLNLLSRGLVTEIVDPNSLLISSECELKFLGGGRKIKSRRKRHKMSEEAVKLHNMDDIEVGSDIKAGEVKVPSLSDQDAMVFGEDKNDNTSTSCDHKVIDKSDNDISSDDKVLTLSNLGSFGLNGIDTKVSNSAELGDGDISNSTEPLPSRSQMVEAFNESACSIIGNDKVFQSADQKEMKIGMGRGKLFEKLSGEQKPLNCSISLGKSLIDKSDVTVRNILTETLTHTLGRGKCIARAEAKKTDIPSYPNVDMDAQSEQKEVLPPEHETNTLKTFDVSVPNKLTNSLEVTLMIPVEKCDNQDSPTVGGRHTSLGLGRGLLFNHYLQETNSSKNKNHTSLEKEQNISRDLLNSKDINNEGPDRERKPHCDNVCGSKSSDIGNIPPGKSLSCDSLSAQSDNCFLGDTSSFPKPLMGSGRGLILSNTVIKERNSGDSFTESSSDQFEDCKSEISLSEKDELKPDTSLAIEMTPSSHQKGVGRGFLFEKFVKGANIVGDRFEENEAPGFKCTRKESPPLQEQPEHSLKGIKNLNVAKTEDNQSEDIFHDLLTNQKKELPILEERIDLVEKIPFSLQKESGRGLMLDKDVNHKKCSSGDVFEDQFEHLPSTKISLNNGKKSEVALNVYEAEINGLPPTGLVEAQPSINLDGHKNSILDSKEVVGEKNNTPSEIQEKCPYETYEPPTPSSSDNEIERSVIPEYIAESSFSDHEAHDPVDSAQIITTSKTHMVASDLMVGGMFERLKTSGVLIHGDIHIQPVSSIHDLNLHSLIYDCLLKKTLRDLTKCQIYAVPILLEWRNLVIIGPPNSGKSLSYVVPILSQLLNFDLYSELKRGNGPRFVVVTSCAESVRHIGRLCSAVSAARVNIITTHGGGQEMERKDELTNGCDVLITTPRCWLRLLKYTFITNMNRMCHLVFDEVDILVEKFKPELTKILLLIERLIAKRKEMDWQIGVQTVFVGETWNPYIEEITFRRIERPILCMTAYLEAALYARINPVMFLMKPENKLTKLNEFLKLYRGLRSVVVCQNMNEVMNLQPVLLVKRNNVLIAHEGITPAKLSEVRNNWAARKDKEPPILLCSDEVLSELTVTDAQWLLHYSLPISKTNFYSRFAVIIGNFRDRILNPEVDVPACNVDIFVDETNEDQFPEVITFMSRLSTPIPENVKTAVKRLKMQKEMKKNTAPMCTNLLQFGFCQKGETCINQHIFNLQRDMPKDIPSSGYVKLKLLRVNSPTYFSARILEHSANEIIHTSCWNPVPNKYALIGLKMSSYYANRDNRCLHGRPKIGDVAGIEIEKDLLFYRAKVLEITSRDTRYNPTDVRVTFLDEGGEKVVQATDLLGLPTELQEYPAEAVGVFLGKLLPMDLDHNWSYSATRCTNNIIKEITALNDSHYFCAGKIALTFGRSLVVDQLQFYEHLELAGCNIVRLSLSQYVLQANLAVRNPDYISNLCEALGIRPSSEHASVLKKVDEKIEMDDETPQWAHLDRDEYIMVYMTTVETPSLIFLRITKFYNMLKKLQKEMSKVLRNFRRDLKPYHLRHGQICAAISPDNNEWNRAQITEVLNSNEVEVFYVDHGDCCITKVSNLAQMPKGFVSCLPFQAIECELTGVKALDGDWLPEAGDAIYELGVWPNNHWKALQAKICDLDLKAQLTGGRHYKVVIVDTTGPTDVVINRELMYKGFANWDPTTKHFLNDVVFVPRLSTGLDTGSDQEDSADESEWDETSVNMESDRSLITTEDKKVMELMRESISSNVSINSSALSEATTMDEALIMLENGDFEWNYRTVDTESLYPGVSQFLIQPGHENDDHSRALMPPPPFLGDKEQSSISEENTFEKVQEESDEVSRGTPTTLRLIEVGICTPVVRWHQTDTHVIIKIEVAEVEDYHLRWSDTCLYFCAKVKDKFYKVQVDLFGPIEPETLVHRAWGLYVEIKIEKIVKGHEWLRLTFDRMKCPWMKRDLQFVKKQDMTLVDVYYEKGLAIVSQMKGTGDQSLSPEPGRPDPTSDTDGSQDSDIIEFTDVPYDSFDPFA